MAMHGFQLIKTKEPVNKETMNMKSITLRLFAILMLFGFENSFAFCSPDMGARAFMDCANQEHQMEEMQRRQEEMELKMRMQEQDMWWQERKMQEMLERERRLQEMEYERRRNNY